MLGRRPAILLLLAGLGAGAAAAETLDEARALHRAGELERALEAYRTVLESLGDSDPAAKALAHNNACVILSDFGDYRTATVDCKEAVRLRRELGDERRLARSLNNLARARQYLGEYEQAATGYREAMDINHRIGESFGEVLTLSNLGTLATQQGKFSEAIRLLRQVESLCQIHRETPWAAEQALIARINQGVVLEKLGAFREALAIYQQALAPGEALALSRRGRLRVNTGVVYRNLGDPVRAMEEFRASAAVYRELGDLSGLSNAHLNLALARHLNLGDRAGAETDYRRALELAREIGDRPEEIQDLFYLGELLLDLDRPAEAIEAFDQCFAAAEESGSAEGRWSALSGLGRVALAEGDLERASSFLEQSLRLPLTM